VGDESPQPRRRSTANRLLKPPVDFGRAAARRNCLVPRCGPPPLHAFVTLEDGRRALALALNIVTDIPSTAAAINLEKLTSS